MRTLRSFGRPSGFIHSQRIDSRLTLGRKEGTLSSMKKVFVFWDNNIFISAKTVAAEREGGEAS